jgi:hypothetical protein
MFVFTKSFKNKNKNILAIILALTFIVLMLFVGKTYNFSISKKNKQLNNSSEPFIKILVGYHKKPKTIIESDIFVPIHLGRDLSNEAFHTGWRSKKSEPNPEEQQWLKNNMIGDNTGDNISKYNRQYCDVSGMYWAFKNLNKLSSPKYIGFFHYRRQFAFRNEIFFSNQFKNCDGTADEKYKKEIGLDEKTIKNTIKNYDIIIPRPCVFPEGSNLYFVDTKSCRIEDLETAFDSIRPPQKLTFTL